MGGGHRGLLAHQRADAVLVGARHERDAGVQQGVSVVIIVWGVYLVSEGRITVGALIAANLLAGRALAPLAAIAQTIFRAHYARRRRWARSTGSWRCRGSGARSCAATSA
jgi:ABC-type protease/lipase transport system fused ATPase/permease subunit